MAGEDPGVVRQREELVVDAGVETAREVLGSGSLGGQQIRTADVADEERVACEDAVGNRVAGVFVHDDADRLGRVTGCREHLERDVTERYPLTVAEAAELEVGVGDLAVADLGTGRACQLEVTREEVGVEVGLDHELDRETALGGRAEVLAHVTAGVDDDGTPGRLVGDQIRRLAQAVQVVLGEEHCRTLPHTPGGILSARRARAASVRSRCPGKRGSRSRWSS